MRVVDSNQKATHLERLELVKRLKSSNNCVIKSNLSDKYAMQKSDYRTMLEDLVQHVPSMYLGGSDDVD